MTDKQVKPFGSWKSPITSDLIVSGTIGLSETSFDGEDIYWLEGRPSEGGRYVIMRRPPSGEVTELTPAPLNARTRVHEYGGGSYVVEGGRAYFSNFADQRLYRQEVGGEPQPLTAESALRFADAVVDDKRHRLICVREDHTESEREAVNSIATVDTESGESEAIVSGRDFYSTPRLSFDGKRLAWLEWNHPNMPWDGCELWVGELDEGGKLTEKRRVAGGQRESVFQPEWSPDGSLYFVSEQTGWWNLYRLNADGEAEALHEMQAEFGWPQWVFRMSSYAIESAERIICSYNENGNWR
ncbi:MAG: PD40 domain-containing protein, partial [Acidobacteria bacterium]|nr:PD40 domain-containing protein [Acidobacteriota bacterium]